MAKTVQYRGEFRSIDGVLYCIELLTDDAAVGNPVELAFPADCPVEIEWLGVDKLEPVQGSSLTLRLISESDRQFVGFYSTSVGSMRCDIYRGGVLYWSGSLDTELYEEPYSSLRDYEVSFTFSDFAPLDRLKWSLGGVHSLRNILDTCLEALEVNYLGVEEFISTSASVGGSALDFSSVFLSCDNFFDEEGEAMTVREVLEGVLRPFALRLVQKAGHLYLYDLNAVWGLGAEEVAWKSDDALLSVDKVYNNVKLSFSPYAHTDLVDGGLEVEKVLADSQTSSLYKSGTDWTNAFDGFRLFVGQQSGLGLTLGPNAKFFRIDSIYSGSDEAGVIEFYRGNSGGSLNAPLGYQTFTSPWNDGGTCSSSLLFSCPLAFIGWSYTGFALKLCVEMLCDVRYNPFEDGSDDNFGEVYEQMKKHSNFVYVPIKLLLKDSDGTVLYHYKQTSFRSFPLPNDIVGSWVSGEGEWGEAALAFYDWEDRETSSGIGGWTKNKPMIGWRTSELPKKLSLRGEGDFIPLPPRGGYLELQVGMGVECVSVNHNGWSLHSNLRWLAFKNPSIILVRSNGLEVELQDIEYNGYIDAQAREELSINTIVGTMGNDYVPSALGVVLNSYLYNIASFARAGVLDCLEKLLMATAYSQYSSRHNVLSGTVQLLHSFGVFADASSSGAKYLLSSEVQDLAADVSVISMTELSEENYQGLNSD